MKVPFSWLNDIITHDVSVEEAADFLTRGGLEVEEILNVEKVKGGLAGLVVGEVTDCVQHPNADKLKLTQVNLGETSVQIVCGAPNVDKGQKVIVAPVGCTIYPLEGDSFKIKKGKLRGEVSEGMICADDEIGLGFDHSGIKVLPNDAPVGCLASEYLKLDSEPVIEIGLTPNRGDAMSILGVARDLKGSLDLAKQSSNLNFPEVTFHSATTETKIQVESEDDTPIYYIARLSNIQVGDSPEFIKTRLEAAGIGSINNVVDITNYVMLELGNPLHAFDQDQLQGEISVALAQQDEKFIALDGSEISLNSEDLTIRDSSGPICIAGVYGSQHSGVSENSNSIALEAAVFNSSRVRRTVLRHQLRTDAAARFDKGVDGNMTMVALNRAIDLLIEYAGAQLNNIEVAANSTPEVNSFSLSHEYLERITGIKLESNTVHQILSAAGIEVNSQKDAYALTIPSYKTEVLRPADVAEEFLRFFGLDNVPIGNTISTVIPIQEGQEPKLLLNQVKAHLASIGLFESVTLSITKQKENLEQQVSLLNPLSGQLSAMRTSVLDSLLDVYAFNSKRGKSGFGIFEFGKQYFKAEEAYGELEEFVLLSGKKIEEESWNSSNISSVYSIKSAVEQVLSIAGVNYQVKNIQEDSDLSEGLEFVQGKLSLAKVGIVHAHKVEQADLSELMFAGFIQWENVLTARNRAKQKFTEFSRFPRIDRDLAVILDKSVQFAEIDQALSKFKKKLLSEVFVFDVFEDKQKLGEGKVSYGLRFYFEHTDRTLKSEEVDKEIDGIIGIIEQKFKGVVRK